MSISAKEFIVALLNVNPEARLTAEQALQHPWMQGTDGDSVESGDDLYISLVRRSRARTTSGRRSNELQRDGYALEVFVYRVLLWGVTCYHRAGRALRRFCAHRLDNSHCVQDAGQPAIA